MTNSVARNNVISNEVGGILVSPSNNNRIYNNTISNSHYSISVALAPLESNTVENCTHFGISPQPEIESDDLFTHSRGR